MIKCILFLLSEAYYFSVMERKQEILKKAGAKGAEVRFLPLDEEDGKGQVEKIMEREGADKKQLLLFADNEEAVRAFVEEGYYVIAVYHEGNREENLMSAGYAVEDLFSLEYSSYENAYLRLAGLPWNILETRRLKLRESTVFDVEDFYRIYKEPSITYYIEPLFKEKEAEIAYMEHYIRQIYGFYGFGLWSVVLKESGQVIGRAGLSVREGFEEPELGFVIEADHQRKGYGYEICEAVLKYAEKELDFDRVQALVDKDNQASLRLLQKLGFSYEEEVTLGEKSYLRMLVELSKRKNPQPVA